MDRKEMLEKLGQYSFVPCHNPNFEEMTDEELDEYLFELESV